MSSIYPPGTGRAMKLSWPHALPLLTTHTIGHELFLRVERQTLTRLPGSMIVLFGIHTYISRLEDEAADPWRARRMLDVIRTAPRDVKDYKNDHADSACSNGVS